MNTPTKKGTARQQATVNREVNLLSSVFSLAVLYDKAEFNPCSKVDLFPLDNLRYRYLLLDATQPMVCFVNVNSVGSKSVASGTDIRFFPITLVSVSATSVRISRDQFLER
jgi:hypothetical protein